MNKSYSNMDVDGQVKPAGSNEAPVDAATLVKYSERSARMTKEFAMRKKRKAEAAKAAEEAALAEGEDPSKAKEAGEKAGEEVEKEAKKEIDMDEHLMTEEDVIARFETDTEQGLRDDQVDERLLKYGRNELTPPPTKPWYVLFFEHLTGFFALLLWLAAFLCFIAYGLDQDQPENLYLGIVLTVVTVLTGIFSYYQDAKSAAVMASFARMLPPDAMILRNGREYEVPAATLVPGDIISISGGNKIPADIRILSAHKFTVDNSSLTGEPIPVKRGPDNKQELPLEATNVAFYGTLARTGSMRGVVIRTGDNTVIGTIAAMASGADPGDTPIAQEIEHFIHIISAVAVFLGTVFLIIGFLKGDGAIDNIVFCIGIIVANVPEGLLATVTVSLTLTAQRMATKNVLVKNLESVETLGSTSVIASDKTGTLTQNIMQVNHLWYDGKIWLPEGHTEQSFSREHKTFRNLYLCATLCNNAIFLNDPKNMERPVLRRATKGDASESAFIKFCETAYDASILDTRAAHPKLTEIPFTSANKYQVSIHRQNDDWNAPRLLVIKGAPERIWSRCANIMVQGELQPRDNLKDKFEEGSRTLMGLGERVLGCAMIELDPEQYPQDFEYDPDDPNFPMEGFTFLGLLALMDPPRAAVPGAVESCQRAGIKVIMVTGDHPDTAEAIAKKVNIIRSPTRRDIAQRENVPMEQIERYHKDVAAMVITGAELLEMEAEELDRILDYDEIVFARTSPAQKLTIVEGLQNKKVQRNVQTGEETPVKHVVAVTGDGVNDSPALSAADIGVAMGLVGSDVAKESADMILLDDNFASIVNGVEEGRLIFDNLKKSIAYTLSSNIPEITPFLINVVVGIPLPLPVVMILCIDLGTDLVPAISLAYENKESNIMEKPPRDMHTERLVTAKLISFSYLQIGVVQALAGFFTYFVVLNDYGFRPNTLANQWDTWQEFDEPSSGYTRSVDLANGEVCMVHPTKSEKFCQDIVECNIDNDACHNPAEALAHAQTAFFISIIVVQWADLLACKTRTLSLRTQGMRNGWLNFGLVFETLLGAFLCYVPPMHDALGTRDIRFEHWFPAMPFSMLILSYDETRKFLLRNLGKDNWVRRNTYY